MNLFIFLFCFVTFWVAIHFLIKDQVVRSVEREVARQLDQQADLARRHHEAVHDIRDELRRTSHQLIATALEPGKQGTVIDHEGIVERRGR